MSSGRPCAVEEQPFATACNTADKFRAARSWLDGNGGAALILEALRGDGFVEPSDVKLTTGTKPFNVFARLASGAMPNPVDQSGLGKHAEEFAVCHNRPVGLRNRL